MIGRASVADVAAGQPILKYGQVIGVAGAAPSFRAVVDRQLARLADEYVARYGRLDGNWPKVMRAFAEANPLFGGSGGGGGSLSSTAESYINGSGG